MPAITAENAPLWKALANEVSAQRPCVGRNVRVTGGRKHKGKEGVVRRHEVNRFSDAFRYGGEANLQLREMAGRYGFRCMIRQANGSTFWIDADKVEVLS